MNPSKNPYVPGAGTSPPELAGRDSLLADAHVAISRSINMRASRSFIFVGLRGVGKTVLLNEIQEIAEREKAITGYVEISSSESFAESIIPTLRSVLLKLDRTRGVNGYVKKGLRVLKSFVEAINLKVGGVEISLDIEPLHGTADSGLFVRDLAELFVAVGEAAKDRKLSVVIFLDEMQTLPSREFEALIMAIHRVSQKNLPFLLIGAGLPSHIKLAGDARTYAERLFQYPELGPLDPEAARNALALPAQRENVRFEDNAIGKVFSLTQGYPYFLQEWGYQAWNTASGSAIKLADIDCSRELVATRLDRNFFKSRYQRVSDIQKQYLHAMAKCGSGPYRTGLIAQTLGKTSQQVSSTREALINSGMIYSPKYGFTAFTVPLFHEFMLRTHRESTRQ